MTRCASFPLLVLALLASCGDSREGSDLKVMVVGEPGGLARRLEAEAVQPTLVSRDGTGAIVAGLASGWRFVDNGRGLIMRLAPVKWGDGKPLVARDAVKALGRAAAAREPALIASGLVGRRGQLAARAPIDRVVELSPARPSPLLLEWLAEPALAIALPRRDGLAAYTARATPDGRTLVRRSDDARPAARPAIIRLGETRDAATAIAGFRAGRSDIVLGDGLTGLGAVRTTAPAEALRVEPTWGVYGLRCNPRRTAIADPALRQALSRLADRDAAARQFGIAALVPTARLLPPGMAPAAAAAVEPLVPAAQLATAGVTPETPLRLTIIVPPGADHRRAVTAAVRGWILPELAGAIRVRLITADRLTRRRLASRNDWDLMVDETSSAIADPVALLDRWRCRGRGPCNPAADTLLDAGAASTDRGRRAGLAAAAEGLWLTAPPMIPLFGTIRWALVAPGVDGWTPNRAGAHPLTRLAVTGR